MKYFEGKDPNYGVEGDFEADRTFDTTDPKWAHPANLGMWGVCTGSAMPHNPTLTMEERANTAIAATKNLLAMFGKEPSEDFEVQKYTIPGCPEEPDTETVVCVYRPKSLNKKKARCMFYCLGGALVIREPDMFPIEEISARHNCVMVVGLYRRSWEAQYPAAINDLHAAYKWMIENAEMLRINPDNVVLSGMSSGAHLATALAFRLKRYGYSPRGVVAILPQTDDREDDRLSHKIYTSDWDAGTQRQALRQWLGLNYGSTQTGPEALANHATIKDCIGYPPLFIHTAEFDPDKDNARDFYSKVTEAKSYAEFHCWGGTAHGGPAFFGGDGMGGEENELSHRINIILAGNIEDCFKYDLRRPWVVEESK